MSLKLPRTIRLDPSDTFVFERPAEPGEWAVTGTFLFADTDVGALAGKARAAFRSGFVGVGTLGFSTLVVVSEARAGERDAAVAALARHFSEKFGAPDAAAALRAAGDEIDFAASLCRHDVNTVIAMHRTIERGDIREQFRSLTRAETPPGADPLHAHARAFRFVEVDEEPAEEVDLMRLREGKRP